MRSSGEGSSPVGAGRIVTLAVAGAVFLQCSSPPPRLRRKIHRGALIVHQDLAAEVIAIFEQLLQLRYPIEKIRTVDAYPAADDELSMADNNTSAFNCRDIPGTGRWSLHAFGRAIDLNPLLNPFIDRTGAFQPKNAAPYLDRNRTDPGLLHAETRPCASSPIVVGAGAATGELPSTISTLSADCR